MRKLSPTETACLLAILIILAIGCEKSKRQGRVDTTFNVADFRPLDYAIRDTDYYDNNPYIPCTSGLCLSDETSICEMDYFWYESKCNVYIAMYPIIQHSELQPGY